MRVVLWCRPRLVVVKVLVLGVLIFWGAGGLSASDVSGTRVPAGVRVVAFAQDTLANDWRLAQARELEAAFANYPDIKFVVSNASGSTALQVQHVEDFTDQGVDLLMVSPRDAAAMTPAIARAHRQGIPVVLITRRILGDEYTSFVGPDDEDIAAEAARLIADRLNGSGRVFVLQGVPTASTAIDRTRGFLREIANYPDIEVVAVEPGNYLRSDALRVMDTFLEGRGASGSSSEGPGFDALYAQSDSMAVGARIALDMAGFDSAQITTVGIDYIDEARTAIRQGTQTASFVYPTSAREAAELAVAILEGREVPRSIRVPSTLVTRENVDAVEPIF